MLHFAPEAGLRSRLAALANVDYVTADITPGPGDIAVDITSMGFDDESFDVVLCVHVLEHVADDGAALREIYRVLRPGGWAVVQVLLWHEITDEDPSVISPEERLRRLGQEDHVRVYGRDFLDPLAAAGLRPSVVDRRNEVSVFKRWRLGLYYGHRWLDRCLRLGRSTALTVRS